MRILLVVILGMILSACPGWAQDESVATATSALQGVLSNLEQSVEKLSLNNEQWTARDNQMKQQVAQLQAQFGALQVQGDSLNKTAARLQEENPRRTQQLERLQEENSDLDHRIQKDEIGIKAIRQSLGAESPEPKAEVSQKEELKLMKMIDESQQRQELLHKGILEFQENKPLSPSSDALAHQQLLEGQIKDLEAKIAVYPSQKPAGNINLSGNAQLHQLELDLQVSEHNYLQLKDLMAQMTKKAQNTKMTVSQHVEEEKLQGKISDLKRQAVGLKIDLDDSRSQMVDLDKRKSSLETMIKQ